ncbi:hypothetical protein C8Q77DRAFT_1156721 [Trametes polyzona]|nr:hypothetical protein C8Q77DRAFT_1156721 [Trametes polyzona]
MQSYITTSAVGGREGLIFQDVFIRVPNGNIIISDVEKNQLDLHHPIKRITVSHGWVVDGISVTYQLVGGGVSTFDHGSQFPHASVIDFDANEVLVGVFGRAGPQAYYKRDLVNNIGFVIYDTAKASTRIVGPFGNGNNSNEGKAFYVSDVIAFGGFAKEAANASLLLSGLFFYKDAGKQ